MQVAFGSYQFDGDRRCLEKQGRAVDLTPKAFRLLEILLERRPNAVSRSELADLVWPDVVVVEENLTNLIAEIRRALSDDDWIRTVRKFGYRFAGELIAMSVADGSAFQMKRGDLEVRLREGINLLGRTVDSIIPIAATGVSRNHAQIVVEGGKAVLHDLGSRNGTYVRGVRLRSPIELRDGDPIVLGSELIGIFEVVPAPPETRSLTSD